MKLLIILSLVCVVCTLHTKYVDYLCIGDSKSLIEQCNKLSTHSRVWMTNVNAHNVSTVIQLLLTDHRVTGALVQSDDLYELVVHKEVIYNIVLPTPMLIRGKKL